MQPIVIFAVAIVALIAYAMMRAGKKEQPAPAPGPGAPVIPGDPQQPGPDRGVRDFGDFSGRRIGENNPNYGVGVDSSGREVAVLDPAARVRPGDKFATPAEAIYGRTASALVESGQSDLARYQMAVQRVCVTYDRVNICVKDWASRDRLTAGEQQELHNIFVDMLQRRFTNFPWFSVGFNETHAKEIAAAYPKYSVYLDGKLIA
jgi:hypothetical protein